jgi:transposase
VSINFFFIEGTQYASMSSTKEATVFDAIVIDDAADPPDCNCGIKRLRNGLEVQTIMDTPAHGARIVVKIARQRYRCAAGVCPSIMRPLPAIPPRGRITYRLRSYIAARVIHRPFGDLAVDTGLDRSTIRRIFDEITTPKIAAIHANAPRVLGIDEFKLRGRYRCILTDVENRRPYDLLTAHNKATVIKRLQAMPEGVEAVVMDMSSNFRASVEEALPGVSIVADRFHFVKYLNGKLDEFRRDARKARKKDGSLKGIKDRRFLLMTRHGDLTDEQAKTLEKWLKEYPSMSEIAAAKWQLEKVHFCATRADAEEHLKAWHEGLGPFALAAFACVIKQIADWREPILAYFDYRFTAGYTEAMNGIIKDLDARGRGLDWGVLRGRFILSRDRLMIGNARRHTKVKARHPTRKRHVSRRRRWPPSMVKALEP